MSAKSIIGTTLLTETAQLMDIVDLEICLQIYKVCNDEQFEFMSGSDFVNFMNLKPTSRPVKIIADETHRVCHMIYMVSKAISPKATGEAWARAMVEQTEIPWKYYYKHRTESTRELTTEYNQNYAKKIARAIAIAKDPENVPFKPR